MFCILLTVLLFNMTGWVKLFKNYIAITIEHLRWDIVIVFISRTWGKCYANHKWDYEKGKCTRKYYLFLPKTNYFHTNNLSACYHCKKKCINCFVLLTMSACPHGYFGMNCRSKCLAPYYGLKCKSKCSCYHSDCHHIHGCNQNQGGEFYVHIW